MSPLLVLCLSNWVSAQSVWTLRSTPLSGRCYKPAGKPGLYLIPTAEISVAGDRQRYLRSTSGLTWNSVYLPFADGVDLVCENSRFVGIQTFPDTRIWYSDNGTTFTAVTSAAGGDLSTFLPADITYGNGVWIMTGTNGWVLRSIDNAASWRFHQTQAESLGTVRYGGGKFLARAGNPASLISPDGITWSIGPVIPGDSFCFAGGRFITGSHRSPDGLNWTEIPAGELAPSGLQSPPLVGGNNGTALSWNLDAEPAFYHYAAGSWGGPYPSGVLSNIYDAALCGDLWIAVTVNSRVLTSPVPALPPPVPPLLNVSPALRLSWPSQTGRNYLIQRSTDQITWTDYTGAMTGTGGSMEWLAPASSTREYFRVQVR